MATVEHSLVDSHHASRCCLRRGQRLKQIRISASGGLEPNRAARLSARQEAAETSSTFSVGPAGRRFGRPVVQRKQVRGPPTNPIDEEIRVRVEDMTAASSKTGKKQAGPGREAEWVSSAEVVVTWDDSSIFSKIGTPVPERSASPTLDGGSVPALPLVGGRTNSEFGSTDLIPKKWRPLREALNVTKKERKLKRIEAEKACGAERRRRRADAEDAIGRFGAGVVGRDHGTAILGNGVASASAARVRPAPLLAGADSRQAASAFASGADLQGGSDASATGSEVDSLEEASLVAAQEDRELQRAEGNDEMAALMEVGLADSEGAPAAECPEDASWGEWEVLDELGDGGNSEERPQPVLRQVPSSRPRGAGAKAGGGKKYPLNLPAASSVLWNPLHAMAASGQLPAVAMLLDSKEANVDLRNKDGLTALQLAVLGGRLAVAKLLLAKGASMEVKSSGGASLLHMAVLMGNAEMLRLLVASAARRWRAAGGGEGGGLGVPSPTSLLNAVDEGGWTPLHVAAVGANTGMLRALILLGADPRARTQDGRTALDLVRCLGQGYGISQAVNLLKDPPPAPLTLQRRA